MTSGERISRPYVGLVHKRQCSSVNRVTREEHIYSRMGITKALYNQFDSFVSLYV